MGFRPTPDRFADNVARVAKCEATDALVMAWTRTLGKMEVFAIAQRHSIPLAPVRDVGEVMRDRHMHQPDGPGLLPIDGEEGGFRFSKSMVLPTRNRWFESISLQR